MGKRLVVIGAVLGVLLACSPIRAPTTVSLLVAGDPVELDAYREMISGFEAATPDLHIDLITAANADDLLVRLSTSIATGHPPDLFLVNYRYFAQYAVRGALEPLQNRLASSPALDEDAFFPEVIDAFRFRDTVHCLAQNASSLVVYYNRHLFEAAGVAEPPAAWTWDEMIGAAQLLTQDIDGDGAIDQHGFGAEPLIIRIAPFVWSAGAEIVDDPNHPTALSFHAPAARNALARFLALGGGESGEGGGSIRVNVVPSELEIESEDLESRFMNGRLAMYLSSRRATPTFRTIEGFDWDVAPLPHLGTPVSVLHADGYCMTAGSSHKDEAWRFLEFALGSTGQRIMARTGRTVPSLRAVASSEAFLDPEERPSRSRVFLDAIPALRPLPVVATWPEIESTADVILEQAMYEGLPIDEVIALLEEETRTAFERADD